jgi:hypothetical protein
MLIIIAAGLLIAVVVPKAGHAEEIRVARGKQLQIRPDDLGVVSDRRSQR